MPEPANLTKAVLKEIDPITNNVINDDKAVTVQFNPETLKVSFANQIATPAASGDQTGTPARQFVGAGTTKLSLQLWFDVNAPQQGDQKERDVRKFTEKVAYFITPRKDTKDKTKLVPPLTRFLWGSFQFDGIMDSLEESLEFFSNEGIPLRASMTLNMSQQKIPDFVFAKDPPTPPGISDTSGSAPGTTPLVAATAGISLQGLADSQGVGADWKAIATANGIENPRLLAQGQLINLNIRASIT
jgi:contractile injection system tube protein